MDNSAQQFRISQRRLVVVQVAAWGIVFVMMALEGYLNLPSVGSVPLSAVVTLIGAPLVIACSFLTSAPNVSSKALANFMRFSPWAMGMLWFLAAWIVFCGLMAK